MECSDLPSGSGSKYLSCDDIHVDKGSNRSRKVGHHPRNDKQDELAIISIFISSEY